MTLAVTKASSPNKPNQSYCREASCWGGGALPGATDVLVSRQVLSDHIVITEPLSKNQSSSGAHFTKRFYIYELKYLVNSCKTVPASIRESHVICELIPCIRARIYCLSETGPDQG